MFKPFDGFPSRTISVTKIPYRGQTGIFVAIITGRYKTGKSAAALLATGMTT
jgi:hypothetical protein